MLTARKIKLWYGIHKWTSLISTAFLLMLCLTGLPLIFHDELDDLLARHDKPPDMPASTPKAPIEQVIAAGLEDTPGWVVQYVVWDRDEPDVVLLNVAATRPAPRGTQRILAVDARTAKLLHEEKIYEGVVYVLLQSHKDMFGGLSGSLFLGLMGLMFIVAIVSGAVVYGPFMRKLSFGTLRRDRSRRLKWLDLHNLMGIVTLCWALVVGATGIINTWAELIFKLWQVDQVAAMIAPYRNKPAPSKLASVDRVIATARAATPGMTPSFVAFPRMPWSGNHHFLVLMRGESALTSRMLKPVLVDAETAALTDTRDPPWYAIALLLSQPLHFGDYGGLPLKIIWALLDLVTICVLGSGLYLWLARPKSVIAEYLDEIERADAQRADARPGT